jgi:hypothetical protein
MIAPGMPVTAHNKSSCDGLKPNDIRQREFQVLDLFPMAVSCQRGTS